MYQRRDLLKLALGGLGATALSAGEARAAAGRAAPVQAPPPAADPEPHPGVRLGPPVEFKPSTPADLARELAKKPFVAVGTDLPDPFRNLTFDQYQSIRLKPDARIWAGGSSAFIVEPLHRGFQYTNGIVLNLVEDGQARRVIYDVGMFDFDKLKPSPKIGDIGFSGFRIVPAHPGDAAERAEVANFQGANFFRATAEGQVAGLMARALALKVADPNGEETPSFREIWIQKPGAVSDFIVVDALLDSESLAGAYRFTIRPGEATIIDTECSLFTRTDVDNFGLASMSATHLLGFMDHKNFDDYRPNVGEVGGLQMLTGAGEWVWRPVTNRGELQISTFVDSKPRGFGCMIRDRNFENYLDEENHWERRPSLWIEPLGEWGEGGVQLIEIPSQSDANDNILCFWRPKMPLKAHTESAFAYRQFWCWDPPERPDLARATRSHSGLAGKRPRFFIEFSGDILGDPVRTAGLTPTLTANKGSITMAQTFFDKDRKTCRVLFELDPQGAAASELRLLLESKGTRVSETWLYRWTSA